MNLKNHWPGILLFLSAFELALLGLNPSFYMDDSPEIITASACLGIAHPPGYPLYTLLGRLFSLLPLGPPCLRVNLLAALSGTLACWLLFLVLEKVFKLGAALSWSFAFLWMAGATAFPAALSAKNGIYQLTAAFLLAVFAALFRGRPALAFFLFGISLGNHWMTMAAAAGGFAYLLWVQLADKPGTAKELLKGAAFLALGLSLYLYLPLRSSLDPLVNWAHPVDLRNFLRHVSRYVDKNKDFTWDLSLWAGQAWYYLKSAFLEFYGLGVLAPLGAWAAWRRWPHRVLGPLLAWAGLFAAVCVFSKFSSQRIYLMQNYSIASFIFILVFSALGFHLISEWGSRKFPRAGLAAPWLALALSLILAGTRLERGGMEYYTYTYDYVLSAWKSVPPGGLFFCKGDVLDFPCWYFQMLEGKRPDLPVLGAGSLPMDWYRMFLARTQPGLQVPYPHHEKGKEYISGHLIKWMVDHNPGRRLFFTYPDLKEDGLEDFQTVPNGLTQEAFPGSAKPLFDERRAEGLWNSMRLRHFQPPDDSVDEVSWDHFLKDYAMARLWMGVQEIKEADALTAKSGLALSPSSLGRVRILYARGLTHLLWVRNWDPSNPQSSVNVGLVYSFLGDQTKAMNAFQEAMTADPDFPDAYYDAGLTAARMGDKEKARDWFEKTLALDNNYTRARQALQNLESGQRP